jgi:hypothetical protein
MTGWVLIILGLVVFASTVVVYRRGRPRQKLNLQACLYVDGKLALNIYEQGEFPALRQEIEDYHQVDHNAGGGIGAGPGKLSVTRAKKQEQTSKYIKEIGLITVARLIIKELEQRGEVSHVDLFDLSIEPGSQHRLKPAREAPLSKLKPPVRIGGTFVVVDSTADEIVLTASYGHPSAEVRVTCRRDQFLLDVPTGEFTAHCFGWGRPAGPRTFVMDKALAIYQL